MIRVAESPRRATTPGTARPHYQQTRPINVARSERWLSGLTGGAMTYYGIKRRTFPGLLAVALGVLLVRRGYSGQCAVYRALRINTARRGQATPTDFFDHGIHIEQAVTVNRPSEELFRFWHNFENLPRFMSHLRSVRTFDGGRSHWQANAPAGRSVEWDAQIINEEPNALIAWRSLEGADIDNAGSVRFIPLTADRGTEVRVVIEYIPPAGAFGAALAKLFGEEPSQQVQEDLRKFKQIAEAGEVPTTQGQPHGMCK